MPNNGGASRGATSVNPKATEKDQGKLANITSKNNIFKPILDPNTHKPILQESINQIKNDQTPKVYDTPISAVGGQAITYKPESGIKVYRTKPVVELAPDAVVYVRNSPNMVMCEKCQLTYNINKYITSISTDSRVDSPPGTASVTFKVPRHDSALFFHYGHCVFYPMMEISIFTKGRFLRPKKMGANTQYVPTYYRIFWGVITNVDFSYNGGEHTITISCKDMLYWWEITRMVTNPSRYAATLSEEFNLTAFQSIFNHMNPFDIIMALSFECFGQLVPPFDMAGVTNGYTEESKLNFNLMSKSLMDYWRTRQEDIGGSLRIFGIGNDFNVQESDMAQKAKRDEYLAQLRNFLMPKQKGGQTKINDFRHLTFGTMYTKDQGDKIMTLDPNLFNSFYTYNFQGSVSDWSSSGDNLSRLEIAGHVKEAIGYEFFQDCNGDIVFKPPFYNLEVRDNIVHTIDDIDVVDYDITESIENIVTKLDVKGAFNTYYEGGNPGEYPVGAYIDHNLAMKYGIRGQEITRQYLHKSYLCTMYAMAELSRYNAKRFTGKFTLLGRPELRLGYPVYYEPEDSYYYITGISHSYNVGTSFQTTASFEGVRRKYLGNSPAMRTGDKTVSYKYEKGGTDIVFDNPLKPRFRGVPNVVLVGRDAVIDKDGKPIYKASETYIKSTAQGTTTTPVVTAPTTGNSKVNSLLNAGAALINKTAEHYNIGVKPADSNTTAKLQKDAIDYYSNVNYNTKVYAEQLQGKEQGIQFFSPPIEIVVEKPVYKANLGAIPVSDEAGYEIIGGLGYGRRSRLLPNGTIGFYSWTAEGVSLTATGFYAGAQDKKIDYEAQLMTSLSPDNKNTYDSVINNPFNFSNYGMAETNSGKVNDSFVAGIKELVPEIASTKGISNCNCQYYLREIYNPELEPSIKDLKWQPFNPATYGLSSANVKQSENYEAYQSLQSVGLKFNNPSNSTGELGNASSRNAYNWVYPLEKKAHKGTPYDPENTGLAGRKHDGIDLNGVDQGTKCIAVADGTIIEVVSSFAPNQYQDGSYGNHISLDTGGGIIAFYSHLQNVKVKQGQKVKQGDIIAEVDNTGHSIGSHLHFEVRMNGRTTNPEPYIEGITFNDKAKGNTYNTPNGKAYQYTTTDVPSNNQFKPNFITIH